MSLGDSNGLERKRDLDGLRGIAVLLTILLHYVSRSGFFSYLGPPHIAHLLNSAWAGVDVFFVLSGFLIGGIIIDNGKADNFFRVFYLRRALRILPVAVLTIAFSYLILPLLNPSLLWHAQVPPYAYLLFINNFWTALGYRFYLPLGALWSLAIEEQFYLFAPALLLWVRPNARNLLLVAVLLVSPLLRICNLGFSSWDFTPVRLDGFAAGILTAALLREAACRDFALKHRRAITAVVVGLVAAALLFASSLGFSEKQQVAFGVSLNSIAAAGVILLLQINPESRLSNALSHSGLVLIGRYSYFLYLMHVPIMVYTLAAYSGGPNLLRILLASSITLLGAWASWRFLEAPLIARGKNYTYTSTRDPRVRCDVVAVADCQEMTAPGMSPRD
jgi:peptidoglycan/LPS O-acetylase OafA/YrhL